MKKQKDWCGKECHHESPAPHSLSKTEPPAESRMLDGHPRALKQEINRGQTIASASGQRDHQVVDQTRNPEYQKASSTRTHGSMQGAEDQLMSKLAETEIPPLPPKLSRDREPSGADMMGSA